MSLRVGVLGAGSWGTTLASLAAANSATTLWCRSRSVADTINAEHLNTRYLQGLALHRALRATSDLEETVKDADVVVVAVPTHGFRDVVAQAMSVLGAGTPIISLTKGFERGSRKRMTQIVEELLPLHPTGVLTGPNLAKEILGGQAAASVLATSEPQLGSLLAPVFSGPSFRVYRNDDVTGCELGGALKNVMALASGMADGLGAGDSTRAALITRGLAELNRLGRELGGAPETFAGLAGMGDLVATCTSSQSRNRYFGEQLARGRSVDEITAEMDQVAEGVPAAPVMVELAAERGVEVPIASQVVSVIEGRRSPAAAYEALLQRELRTEH